jgi:hypothetical protein
MKREKKIIEKIRRIKSGKTEPTETDSNSSSSSSSSVQKYVIIILDHILACI